MSMFGEFASNASYQLKHQARCIAALEGDTDRNTFLLASLVLRGDNEVHVLEFNEDTNEVWCQRVYSHPHEVWSCSSCPAPEHQELLITTHSTGTEQRTSLWRMDGLSERESGVDGAAAQAAPEPERMSELLQLGGPTPPGESRGILWNTVLPEQVASVQCTQVRLWQLTHGSSASSAAEINAVASPAESGFSCGRWDPHHAHSLSLACGKGLHTLDARSMKISAVQEHAHDQKIRCVDYNPNKPNVLLSSGDDYQMRFWDLRKPHAPVLAWRAHDHWVSNASYNRFHDQLLLSCGTDSQVKLWRATSISSTPTPDFGGEAEPIDEGDGLVKLYDDHEHSVFGAVWSAADAWIFASLSLDGKCVINHVPPAEKYKILL